MIGKKIYEYRKKEQISQEELAERVGVTRQTISNWELNETIPDIEQAKKVSQILGISLDELTGNKTEYIMLKKITKNEHSTKSLLKITGITLGISIFFLLIIIGVMIAILNYFKATPAGQQLIFECKINEETTYYEINSDMDNKITSFNTSNPDLQNIDITKYQGASKLQAYLNINSFCLQATVDSIYMRSSKSLILIPFSLSISLVLLIASLNLSVPFILGYI